MKRITLLAIVGVMAALTSCNKEENNRLQEIERILPGEWRIDSLQILGSANVTLNGEQVKSDIIIRNIGALFIPKFDTGRLSLNVNPAEPVEAIMEVNGVDLFLDIEKLFLSGGEYFAYLRLRENNLSTPQGSFIWDTKLFYNNSYIDVISNDRIEFRKASGEPGNKVFLSRL